MSVFTAEQYYARFSFTTVISGETYKGKVEQTTGHLTVTNGDGNEVYSGIGIRTLADFRRQYASFLAFAGACADEGTSSFSDRTGVRAEGCYTAFTDPNVMLKVVKFPSLVKDEPTDDYHFEVCLICADKGWDEDVWVESLFCTKAAEIWLTAKSLYGRSRDRSLPPSDLGFPISC